LRKLLKIVVVSAGALVLSAVVQWPTSPLAGRKLKSVTVKMTSYSGGHQVDKTITLDDPAAVAAIEKSMTRIRCHFAPNSNEGYPKYRMNVTFEDGTTKTFSFARGEWGYRGSTPSALIRELEKNGL
jgi:hypothetical protein